MFSLLDSQGRPKDLKVDTQDEVVRQGTRTAGQVFEHQLARALAFEEAPGSSGQEESEFRFSMADFLSPETSSSSLRSPSPLKQQRLAVWSAPAQTERRRSSGTTTAVATSLVDKPQDDLLLSSLADDTCLPPTASHRYRRISFGSNKPLNGNLLCESLPSSSLREEDSDNVFYIPATQADLCSTHPAVDLSACPATWSGHELWKHFCEANDPSGDSSNDESEATAERTSPSSSPRAESSLGFDNLLKAAAADEDGQGPLYLLVDTLGRKDSGASSEALFVPIRHPGPSIGESHQSELPEVLTEEQKLVARPIDEERAGVLEWSPDMIEEEQVDKYLAYVKGVLEVDFSLEEALRRLNQHKYDVNATLAAFLFNPSDFKRKEVWTEDEESRFIQAYYLYRKQWGKYKNLLPDKTPAALMQYYYNWRSGWYNEDDESEEESEEADGEDTSTSEPNSPPCTEWPASDVRALPGWHEEEEIRASSGSVRERSTRKRGFDVYHLDKPDSSTTSQASPTAESELAADGQLPHYVPEVGEERESNDKEDWKDHRSKKIRLGSAPLVCQVVPATDEEDESTSSVVPDS